MDSEEEEEVEETAKTLGWHLPLAALILLGGGFIFGAIFYFIHLLIDLRGPFS